jgi:phospholipid-binding lipoprotein MlaA
MMNTKSIQGFFCIIAVLFLAGCSSKPEDGSSGAYDPLESVNRQMWTLNYNYLDPYVIRPTAMAYVHYVPYPVRHGLSNFFSNLGEPVSMVNNLLMGNGHKAVDHFNRFWLNSTFGLLGFMDIASKAGIANDGGKSASDTLGHYGVGNGPYLMLPAVGPYTARDVTSFADNTYGPLAYLNIWFTAGKWVVEGLEARAALVSKEPMLDDSPDPYAFTRDVYLQHQEYKAEIDVDDFNPEEEDMLDGYLDQYSESGQ